MAEINGLTGIARQSVIDRHANKWLRVAGTVYDVFDKNQLVIVCLDGSDIGPNYWLEFDASDWRDEAAPNSVESEGRFRLSTILSHLSFGVHRNLVSEFGFQHPEVLVALDAPEVLLRLQEG